MPDFLILTFCLCFKKILLHLRQETAKVMNYDIFISYRREGGYDTAQHLYNLLTRDHYHVSFDIDTLRNGDFDKSLLNRIDQCKDFILIVDQHAFDRTLDPTFDPNKDWMRQELAYALEKGKNIIPVFLAGVKGFPDNLPDDIKAVEKKNGPEYIKGHFNVFYEDLKKRFFVTPAPKRRSYIIALSVVSIIALVCFSYIYWPYDTTNVPLSYIDDFEDDVHVDIPAMFDIDISLDIDGKMNMEVKFAHNATLNENLMTALVEEYYDDYTPEDLGVESDEELESVIDILNSADPKKFEELYIKTLVATAPDIRLKDTYTYEAGRMDWHIFVRSDEENEYFNAVYRVPDTGNVIFTMALPKSWVPLKHLRNKHIFESTLERVTKAYILFTAKE